VEVPLILDFGTSGGEWSSSRPSRFTPQGKSPWYPLDRRLGGNQSQSGCGGEEINSHLLSGLEPPDHSAHSPAIYITNNHSNLLFLLKWLYSPMRTFTSLMDFSQTSLIDLTVPRPHLRFPVDFFRGGVIRPTPNPQPGGPGLHIYFPWRLGGPVIPPDTEYPFSRLLRHAWATVGLFFSPVTTRGITVIRHGKYF
jgi:hypothetical protein